MKHACYVDVLHPQLSQGFLLAPPLKYWVWLTWKRKQSVNNIVRAAWCKSCMFAHPKRRDIVSPAHMLHGVYTSFKLVKLKYSLKGSRKRQGRSSQTMISTNMKCLITQAMRGLLTGIPTSQKILCRSTASIYTALRCTNSETYFLSANLLCSK